jgi:UDP-glucose 4-epimerase
LRPENPYGENKLEIERLLAEKAQADSTFRFAALRYFNPIGAHPSGRIGEDPHGIPDNLFPYITQVAIGKLPKLRVFGSDYPTPTAPGVRDYIT